MIIASWNINGVRARIDTLTQWLRSRSPDVVCLQEIKTEEHAFPRGPVEDLGYSLAIHGQKGFNGVAILSKFPLEDVSKGLKHDALDHQSRFVSALVACGRRPVTVASVYVPNGNPVGSEKYAMKLTFMKELEAWARRELATETPFVIAGDYNVIPGPEDALKPEQWVEDALFQPEVRANYRRLQSLGLTDAVATAMPGPGHFTFWDYQAGAWQKNNGIRIDHVLLSPPAADRLQGVSIDREVRGQDSPSDHVPVMIELAD